MAPVVNNRDTCFLNFKITALQVDGTLAFLLTITMANKESSFDPPADLLATAKKATWNYNKEHHQRCFSALWHANLTSG